MVDSTNSQTRGKASANQIADWLRALIAPMCTVEMRVIFDDAPPQSHFYTSKQLSRMARDALSVGETAKGVYFTLNSLPFGQSTPARDVDVTARRWLLIDFDPKRDGNSSSTKPEKNVAWRRLVQVKKHLAQQAWPDPIVADSGNGWHLLYRLNLPNDEASKVLVNDALKGLAVRFSDERIDIDTKVGNASRICKLYGTVARKGEPTVERPHRVSRIVEVPECLTPVSRKLLRELREPTAVETTQRASDTSKPVAKRNPKQFTHRDAQAYLRKCEPAVSGCNGHTTTLNTAQKLLGTFPNLTDEEAFNLLWSEWNPTCEPPWNEDDLRRKVSQARNNNPQPPSSNNTHKRSQRSAKPVKRRGNEKVSRTIQHRTLPAEAYKPFPSDALPEPLKSFAQATAEAIGCDMAFVAVPMLSVLAAAIGNSRVIELNGTWQEPSIIWSVIVGESGTQKTPAFKQAAGPIREYQERRLREHVEELDEYNKDIANYEREMEKWKKGSKLDEPPKKPLKPTAIRHLVSDATIEALAQILADNPRGVLLLRDEIAGWIDSFNLYSKGNSDRSNWLSIFSADGILVDRKTGDRQTLSIPRPAVSVAGGIQPATLERVFGEEHRESGLLARILLAWPPRRAKKWSDKKVSLELKATYSRVVQGLLKLKPRIDDEGQPTPFSMPLTSLAKKKWISFVDQHGLEQVAFVGDEAAAWSKLEGYAARLALVIHCVRIAAKDPSVKSKSSVDLKSIRCGIELSRWFGREALRVYAMLRESEVDRELRQMAETIALRRVSTKARELSDTDRRFPTSDDADRMLQRLVDAGYGEWKNIAPTSKGGRPSRAYWPKTSIVRES